MSVRHRLLELLYQAVASPYGIALTVSHPSTVRAELYKVRKEQGDPALSPLHFHISPYQPQTEVWIVKAIKDHADVRRTREEASAPPAEEFVLDIELD